MSEVQDGAERDWVVRSLRFDFATAATLPLQVLCPPARLRSCSHFLLPSSSSPNLMILCRVLLIYLRLKTTETRGRKACLSEEQDVLAVDHVVLRIMRRKSLERLVEKDSRFASDPRDPKQLARSVEGWLRRLVERGRGKRVSRPENEAGQQKSVDTEYGGVVETSFWSWRVHDSEGAWWLRLHES
eukprot:526908-Rhodomonas_salina.3